MVALNPNERSFPPAFSRRLSRAAVAFAIAPHRECRAFARLLPLAARIRTSRERALSRTAAFPFFRKLQSEKRRDSATGAIFLSVRDGKESARFYFFARDSMRIKSAAVVS
jgi:hypothetical protein